jgi:hypothetical protein
MCRLVVAHWYCTGLLSRSACSPEFKSAISPGYVVDFQFEDGLSTRHGSSPLAVFCEA